MRGTKVYRSGGIRFKNKERDHYDFKWISQTTLRIEYGTSGKLYGYAVWINKTKKWEKRPR